jgi:hypothetical protein
MPKYLVPPTVRPPANTEAGSLNWSAIFFPSPAFNNPAGVDAHTDPVEKITIELMFKKKKKSTKLLQQKTQINKGLLHLPSWPVIVPSAMWPVAMS